MQARPPRTAAIAAEQVGGDAAFVDKDVATGIMRGLPVLPEPSLRDDVRAPLFVGVYRFF
jgi:hypothetical protein